MQKLGSWAEFLQIFIIWRVSDVIMEIFDHVSRIFEIREIYWIF